MEVEARKVVWSHVAKIHLQSIYEFGVETFSVNAADAFIDELIDLGESLTPKII